MINKEIVQKCKSCFQNNQHNDALMAAGIMMFAFLYKILIMKTHFAVGWDEPNYLQLGAAFAKGHWAMGLHPYWSPGYPLCIALFASVFQNIELAGRLVSMAAGTLILYPLYVFSKTLFNRKAAMVSVCLLALYPPFADLSTSAWAEPTYIFFVVFGIYWGWQYINGRPAYHALLAGLFFGAAYLTKPEGIGHFVVLLMLAAGQWILDSRHRIRKTAGLLVLGLAFSAVAMPYILYLKQETGQWTISAKSQSNQQFEANAYTQEKYDFDSLSEDNQRLPMDMIFHQGDFLSSINRGEEPVRKISIGLLARKYSTNLYKLFREWIPRLFGIILMLVFILGLFRDRWPSRLIPLHLYLLSYVLFYWLVLIPLFHISDRYLYPGFILCFVWMGKGWLVWEQWIRHHIGLLMQKTTSEQSVKKLPALSMIIVCLLTLVFSYLPELGKMSSHQKDSDNYYADAVELKEAGQWIRQNSDKTPVIMSYNKAVDFYAGCIDIRKGVSFSNNSIDRILDYAAYKNVDYLVVTSRYLTYFPNLSELLTDYSLYPQLELVYEDSKYVHIRVFKLQKNVTNRNMEG